MSGLELQEQLAKQLRFLQTSCREYDAGDTDEAIRMATAMRVMFHHNANTKSLSLLVQMSASYTEMLSTCGRPPSKNHFYPGLIQIVIDPASPSLRNKLRSKPKFESTPVSHRRIPFSAWWEEDIFFSGGRRISRKKLILDAANKDGGAHVDPTLPLEYRWMVEGAGLSMGIDHPDFGKAETPLFAPHLASLRQIAHEVFSSPDLLTLAG